jgi:2-polyprenyl-3-methyl-5-hydroxy-6-metoxy-1,4-benzoquinol methylase
VFLDELDYCKDEDFYEDSEKNTTVRKEYEDCIEYWSYPRFYEKYRSVFNHFFEDRWRKISKTKREIKSLLDVGCGYGFFLHYLKDRIPDIRGIELNEKVADYARNSMNVPVTNCSIEKYSPDRKFDCIVTCDVLEHVIDPLGMLRKCRELLLPDGVLFLQVPNLIGFKLPVGHSWGLPHHIWQFNLKTSRFLLNKAKLRVVKWHTGVLGVIGYYERGGPTLFDKFQWLVARKMKIGNRLQLVCVRDDRQ